MSVPLTPKSDSIDYSYSNNDMNYLLHYYLGTDTNIFLAPIDTHELTDDNLMAGFKSLPPHSMVLPIRLENQHLMYAYIRFKSNIASRICYINSQDDTVPNLVDHFLQETFLNVPITIYEVPGKYNDRDYGPSVIEILKSLAKTETNFDNPIILDDAEVCRNQHIEILRNMTVNKTVVTNEPIQSYSPQQDLSVSSDTITSLENEGDYAAGLEEHEVKNENDSGEEDDSDSGEDSWRLACISGYEEDNGHDECDSGEEESEKSGDEPDNEENTDEEKEDSGDESDTEEDEDDMVHQITSKKTSKLRVKVSDRLEWFEDSDEGKEKEKRRMVQTQNRFFDIDRTNNQETKKLAEIFRLSRCGSSQGAIDITQYSGRAYITADAGALKIQLRNKSLDELSTLQGIKKTLGYEVKIPKTNNMCNGVYEYIQTGEAKTCYQVKPLPGHLGNFQIIGLGKYGNFKPSHVLSVIYLITGVPQVTDSKTTEALYKETEQKLAKLFLDAALKPFEINKQTLVKYGICITGITPTTINKLNRILVLVDYKEASRRMYPGKKTTKEGKIVAIEEMPFAIANYRALKLVVAGKLRMEQIFSDHSTNYGLSTGQSSSTRELEIKLNRVDELHSKTIKFTEEEEKEKTKIEQNHSGGYFTFFREPLHQECRANWGGENDTDNDEYESSDEETKSYRT
jgi:hypothetical protein